MDEGGADWGLSGISTGEGWVWDKVLPPAAQSQLSTPQLAEPPLSSRHSLTKCWVFVPLCCDPDPQSCVQPTLECQAPLLETRQGRPVSQLWLNLHACLLALPGRNIKSMDWLWLQRGFLCWFWPVLPVLLSVTPWRLSVSHLGGCLRCAEHGLNPTTGSPSPWSPPDSSTSHLHCPEVQEPGSQRGFKIFKISGAHSDILQEWLPSRRLGCAAEV